MSSALLLAILFAFVVALAEGSKKCEPITIPLCQGIGYNQTSYPNSYGHEKQEEAGLEVHQFYPLVEVGCYRHLKFFLCTMYTPICQENYDLQVLPCQEVCLEAQRRCEPLMQQYGFKWPMTLACERLPRIADQERTGTVCAATPDTPNPLSETDTNKVEVSESDLDAFQDAQDQPDDSETTDNSVRRRPASPSDPDTAIRRGQVGSDAGFPVVGIDVVDAQCQCRCVRPFHISADPSMRVHNLSNCAYACHSKGLEFAKKRYNLNTWIAVFSGICLGLSVLTVLTFLIDMERFPYPERPIFFLALCQLMVSIGFLIRVGYGHDSIACNGALLRSGHGGQSGVCTLVFVLVYFFGMASSTWWVILSLTWVLAAVPQWATEWIAKYATCFHLFAWSLPALQTLLVVLFGAVEGDPITGICYVGTTNVGFQRAFVLGPLIVYFSVGVLFLFVGFANLWGIRSSLKKTNPGIGKLTQLMSKIGIFSVLYTVPAIFTILALFYEQHYRPTWEQSMMCPCAQKVPNGGETLTLLALLKTASMLVVGWTSGVWICSAKTLQSWRRFLCCGGGRGRNEHSTIPYTEHSLNRAFVKSPPYKYQAADVIYAKRDCLSPMAYSTGTLRHFPGMHAPMLPEKV